MMAFFFTMPMSRDNADERDEAEIVAGNDQGPKGRQR